MDDATTLPPSPLPAGPYPIGTAVAGIDGEPLGHVAAVYADTATGRPAWAAVQGARHGTVVPLAGSRFDGSAVHVPWRGEQVRTAPVADPSTLISAEQEDALARHYGLRPPSPVDGPAPEVVVVQTEQVVYTTRVVPVDEVRTVPGEVVPGEVVPGVVVGGDRPGAAPPATAPVVIEPLGSPAADGADDDPFPPVERQET